MNKIVLLDRDRNPVGYVNEDERVVLLPDVEVVVVYALVQHPNNVWVETPLNSSCSVPPYMTLSLTIDNVPSLETRTQTYPGLDHSRGKRSTPWWRRG